MKFKLNTAQTFIPDGCPEDKALARTTHLCVAAHQDDIEIMAYDGIIKCFQQDDKWYTGVVVTNGSGSPRDDVYKQYTDEEMRVVRIKEQKKAAFVGEYSAQILLDHPSGSVKDAKNQDVVDDIKAILLATKPSVVYTHNLADKHDTHIGVALKLIAALRALDPKDRPEAVYGCEVWRDLDWLCDSDKVALDCSAHENLQMALLGVFDSQIAGGKRYDLATAGRRRAHATYHASHSTDVTTGLAFAMDLTPLMDDQSCDPASYLQDYINRFAREVTERVAKMQ